MGSLKRTPLFEIYKKYGGKIIEFGGWEMPVQYSNIIEEHHTVRNHAGLFDVSHMGEIKVDGPDAEDFVQYLVTNDVKKMKDNQVQYNLMCYPSGGVVDDLLIYKYSSNSYMLVVNAANIDKDYDWIMQNKGNFDVKIENMSDRIAQLAFQGPQAEEILQKLTDYDLSSIKFFYFTETKVGGKDVLISRTGYTGEDGFEIYLAPQDAVYMWDLILETGRDQGVKPVGLGARDTLRFEAGLPLYGHEISEEITPLEAGLGIFVKLNTDDFIGKDVLMKQKEEGLKRKLVGFEMIDRGIPRAQFKVAKDGEIIGFVTTGSYSPTLDKNIGLALVKSQYSELGTEFEVLRGKRSMRAKVIPIPFYKKNYKK
ncbi:glycine cleavage system protein T [Anoxybacter fermentans]|uniref:Aminomethyltransferase n=1 Tax=Anoxybacter fermentans TaxID=1323375 RepID=A0A3Q9HPP9_9FIRM|nr:glycine cleavage system aminomethyltransferase GcvT [Anoxybacter fermentans]AZR72906.1 glycine cleavage system protein T [Anoxybacter fermentans]